MSEFAKVHTKADLESLDIDDVLAGYMAVSMGATDEPGSDKSRSYWHGWRNAMADQGHIPKDDAMSQLAREVVGKYRGLN